MTDFASMSRGELRAYLRANDPQPNWSRDHGLYAVNRRLEAMLAERGAMVPRMSSFVATEPEKPPTPSMQIPNSDSEHGRFGGVAL